MAVHEDKQAFKGSLYQDMEDLAMLGLIDYDTEKRMARITEYGWKRIREEWRRIWDNPHVKKFDLTEWAYLCSVGVVTVEVARAFNLAERPVPPKDHPMWSRYASMVRSFAMLIVTYCMLFLMEEGDVKKKAIRVEDRGYQENKGGG